jgi:hypothetical protein
MQNIELFFNALNNNENKEIVELNITFEKINNDKKLILENIFDEEIKNNILEKLKHYKLVDELPDLKYGSYIRWINIKNRSNTKLTNGGLLCDIKIKDKGIVLTCKNNRNRVFELNMSNNIIFQKLSNQELILLSAIEYINSS